MSKKVLSCFLCFCLVLCILSGTAFGTEMLPLSNLYNEIHYGKIASGSSHSLVLKPDGTVWQFGYMGNAYPQNVEFPGNLDIVDIEAYDYKNIAIGSDNTLWVWGNKDPKKIEIPSSVISVDVGKSHYMALDDEGHVWVWGKNNKGQLGDGSNNDVIKPKKLQLEHVIQISCGAEHSMALLDNGIVLVWGENSRGQLGLKTTENINKPEKMPDADNVRKIAAGSYHSIVLKNDNTLWTCGSGGYAQTGLLSTDNVSSLTRIIRLAGIADVYTNYHHNIAVDIYGKSWVWGYNSYGQLGIDGYPKIYEPMQLKSIENIKYAAMGLHHTLFITHDNKIKSCGNNEFGQLGIGRLYNAKTPVNVSLLSDIKSFDIENNLNLAIKETDGSVWQWGNGVSSPQEIPSLFDVEKVAAGSNFGLALKADGTLWSWGKNNAGQLGNGTVKDSYTPTQVLLPESTAVADIACGEAHAVALTEDGLLLTWGYNKEGQLGNGNNTNSSIPTLVTTMNSVIEVVADYNNTIALKADGTVWSWGDNSSGQLGNLSQINSNIPVCTSIADDIVSIGGGYKHTLAIDSVGNIWGWGWNLHNMIGNGDDIITAPAIVTCIDGAVSVDGGVYHSISHTDNGNLYVWGSNEEGQLGNTDVDNKTEQPVLFPCEGIIEVHSGRYHNVALMEDHTLISWGRNEVGQLGDGYELKSSVILNTVDELQLITSPDSYKIYEDNTILASFDSESHNFQFVFTAYSSGKFTIQLDSELPSVNFVVYQRGIEEALNNIDSFDSQTLKQYNFAEQSVYCIYVYTEEQPDKSDFSIKIHRNNKNDVYKQLVLTKNNGCILIVKARNLTDLTNKKFELSYNDLKLNIISAAAQAYNAPVMAGIYDNVEIIEVSPGKILFKIVDIPIDKGKYWSGVLNVIKFSVSDTGTYTFSICEK